MVKDKGCGVEVPRRNEMGVFKSHKCKEMIAEIKRLDESPHEDDYINNVNIFDFNKGEGSILRVTVGSLELSGDIEVDTKIKFCPYCGVDFMENDNEGVVDLVDHRTATRQEIEIFFND